MKTEIEELKNFVMEIDEIEKISKSIDSFNLFETLGLVHHEIRHSNVLTWLLDPFQTHNLSYLFLQKFLKDLIMFNLNSTDQINDQLIFDFETLNYEDVDVKREYKNIDILILIKEKNKEYCIIVENKIHSSESKNQLHKYKTIAEAEFSNHTKIFVFLSPDQQIPSEDYWILYGYERILNILENILSTKESEISKNVLEFIDQYIYILRRNIVGDKNIEEICKNLYKKHSKALDLIFQYRPDLFLKIKESIISRLKEESEIILDSDNPSKSYIRFTTKKIDQALPKLGSGWTNSQRILLFEFQNLSDRLNLKLYIGPGDKTLREKLYKILNSEQQKIFLPKKTLAAKWHSVFSYEILKKTDYAKIEDIEYELTDKKIENSLKNEFFPKLT
ncbi:PD-(D/E)XK nuclease family protein [Leptospira noguchii serovar Autumnalis str. ZUN142]|uniref:PD-(D/E)XK nuclease family protein n=1 Tax=Leptospira noguchii serovar Autumnalis str. ZUN142 TaxID=1085540 RepID=M6UGB5_9LEPT|nr:PD-(D/E)XK nuclease family protein [Leptospira noguchii]EMO40129.1 PD-(D/E)XK nuclease family protein [Leptospira noguchii serovar Autumnalis str. ZUN142]